MFYLEETLTPIIAMPKTIEAFIRFAEEKMVPLYEANGATLMASWYCNSKTLFQITQTWELNSFDVFTNFFSWAKNGTDWQTLNRELRTLMPQRQIRLLETANDFFSNAFHTAIYESRTQPIKTYTKAVLQMNTELMEGFISRQEEGIRSGLPMISFMCSVTGKSNEVIDIWKGNLQEPGYQKQEFYDTVGMTEDWWHWIRANGPQERMVPVFTLPYSPLQ
ncbi:hypothetical protein [Desulfospira joergensenii]|uniref:hypothetical protein n=1 Tax=Desulfospira joergensenii TaxID=53329 RepID=UPI0003B52632|nr:hypothetical protein [Desulfospira joergensenii]